MTNYAVGWNMPGYMPDTEPYVHATFEEARADVIEELNRAIDDYGEEAEELCIPYELAIAEFESATSPITVTVGKYLWWIEPTDEPVSGEYQS